MKIIVSNRLKISQQVSRKDFWNLLAYLIPLRSSLGFYARPNTDPTKQDFGIKQPTIKDGMRLGRIFMWGSQEFVKLLSPFGDHFKNRQAIESGQYDHLIVPTIRSAKNIVNSLKVNFSQVGYDVGSDNGGMKNFVTVENLLNKFPI